MSAKRMCAWCGEVHDDPANDMSECPTCHQQWSFSADENTTIAELYRGLRVGEDGRAVKVFLHPPQDGMARCRVFLTGTDSAVMAHAEMLWPLDPTPATAQEASDAMARGEQDSTYWGDGPFVIDRQEDER